MIIKPSENKESVNVVWLWGVAFTLGLLIGVIPILKGEILSNKINPFEGWVHVIWGSGLFISAMVVSMLYSHAVWRWAIAVGLGLPAAVALRIVIDAWRNPTSNSLYLFTILYSLFFAAIAASGGAFSGWLLQRAIENLRKN